MDKIKVMENIHDRNRLLADRLNRELTEKGVFAVNVMGAPGVGKTSSLIQMVKRMNRACKVIEGDIESDIDTAKLSALGIEAAQINTGGACHLDSPLIEQAVGKLEPENCVLFIENIGNLVCPAEFQIGEHIKLLICSVTEGSDKPYKYPLAFEKADIILLNKCDLLPYVDFDREFFTRGVRALNEKTPVFEVDARNGAGFDEVCAWITDKAQASV